MYGRKYKIIYPALEAWMRANRVSIKRLTAMWAEHGENEVCNSTMQSYLYGLYEPRLSLCRWLVELTGIPFEELFKEK